MNNDLINTAKDLIKKGTELNDAELIKMGNDLLSKFEPVIIEKTVHKYYVCLACDSIMEFDKPNRRKCNVCGKHKLELREEEEQKIEEPSSKPDMSQFNMQIRDKSKKRVRVNELGEEEGVYTRAESVKFENNNWQDNGIDGKDKDNEILKNFTNVSVRTRQPPKMIEKICRSCNNVFKVHPLHGGGKNSSYICDRCITKRGRS